MVFPKRAESKSPARTLVDNEEHQGDKHSSRTSTIPATDVLPDNIYPKGEGAQRQEDGGALKEEEALGHDTFCVNFDHKDPENPRLLPEWKKWLIAIIALAIEAWANAISAAAAPAIEDISHDLHVSTAAGRVVQAIFLYGFALGAIVFTPLSEDYGRWPVQVVTISLMAILQLPCALAPNYGFLVAFRFLAGFFAASAFNSVGIISDLWHPEKQSWPVNCFAISAEIGAEIGPIIGAFIIIRAGWRWVFGVMGLGSVFLVVVFIIFCPETRAGVILTRRASRKRKETGDNRYFSAHEKMMNERTLYAILQVTLLRPLFMLFREPIVLFFAGEHSWFRSRLDLT